MKIIISYSLVIFTILEKHLTIDSSNYVDVIFMTNLVQLQH